MEKRNFKKIILITLFLFLITFLVNSYFSKGIIYNFLNLNPDSIVRFFEPYKGWAFLIYFLIMVLEVILAPIHPFPFYVAGTILFGPFLAGIIALAGGVIGGIIAFKIAEKLGRRYVERVVSRKKLKKFDHFSKKHGTLSIFLLRLNPLTSTDLWSYVAGISKISLFKFTLATLLGLIPATFLQTYLGNSIKDYPLLFKSFLVILILYLVLAMFWIIYSYKKK